MYIDCTRVEMRPGPGKTIKHLETMRCSPSQTKMIEDDDISHDTTIDPAPQKSSADQSWLQSLKVKQQNFIQHLCHPYSSQIPTDHTILEKLSGHTLHTQIITGQEQRSSSPSSLQVGDDPNNEPSNATSRLFEKSFNDWMLDFCFHNQLGKTIIHNIYRVLNSHPPSATTDYIDETDETAKLDCVLQALFPENTYTESLETYVRLSHNKSAEQRSLFMICCFLNSHIRHPILTPHIIFEASSLNLDTAIQMFKDKLITDDQFLTLFTLCSHEATSQTTELVHSLTNIIIEMLERFDPISFFQNQDDIDNFNAHLASQSFLFKALMTLPENSLKYIARALSPCNLSQYFQPKPASSNFNRLYGPLYEQLVGQTASDEDSIDVSFPVLDFGCDRLDWFLLSVILTSPDKSYEDMHCNPVLINIFANILETVGHINLSSLVEKRKENPLCMLIFSKSKKLLSAYLHTPKLREAYQLEHTVIARLYYHILRQEYMQSFSLLTDFKLKSSYLSNNSASTSVLQLLDFPLKHHDSSLQHAFLFTIRMFQKSKPLDTTVDEQDIIVFKNTLTRFTSFIVQFDFKFLESLSRLLPQYFSGLGDQLQSQTLSLHEETLLVMISALAPVEILSQKELTDISHTPLVKRDKSANPFTSTFYFMLKSKHFFECLTACELRQMLSLDKRIHKGLRNHPSRSVQDALSLSVIISESANAFKSLRFSICRALPSSPFTTRRLIISIHTENEVMDPVRFLQCSLSMFQGINAHLYEKLIKQMASEYGMTVENQDNSVFDNDDFLECIKKLVLGNDNHSFYVSVSTSGKIQIYDTPQSNPLSSTSSSVPERSAFGLGIRKSPSTIFSSSLIQVLKKHAVQCTSYISGGKITILTGNIHIRTLHKIGCPPPRNLSFVDSLARTSQCQISFENSQIYSKNEGHLTNNRLRLREIVRPIQDTLLCLKIHRIPNARIKLSKTSRSDSGHTLLQKNVVSVLGIPQWFCFTELKFILSPLLELCHLETLVLGLDIYATSSYSVFSPLDVMKELALYLKLPSLKIFELSTDSGNNGTPQFFRNLILQTSNTLKFIENACVIEQENLKVLKAQLKNHQDVYHRKKDDNLQPAIKTTQEFINGSNKRLDFYKKEQEKYTSKLCNVEIAETYIVNNYQSDACTMANILNGYQSMDVDPTTVSITDNMRKQHKPIVTLPETISIEELSIKLQLTVKKLRRETSRLNITRKKKKHLDFEYSEIICNRYGHEVIRENSAASDHSEILPFSFYGSKLNSLKIGGAEIVSRSDQMLWKPDPQTFEGGDIICKQGLFSVADKTSVTKAAPHPKR